MMSDKFIETLSNMVGVIACGGESDEFLNDRWVCEGEIDTSLIEADGTNCMRDSTDDLKSVAG